MPRRCGGPKGTHQFLDPHRIHGKNGIHPGKLTCPLKKDYFNRYYIFQPSFFRGYVSFQGGICLHERLISMVHVGRYMIHGASGIHKGPITPLIGGYFVTSLSIYFWPFVGVK